MDPNIALDQTNCCLFFWGLFVGTNMIRINTSIYISLLKVVHFCSSTSLEIVHSIPPPEFLFDYRAIKFLARDSWQCRDFQSFYFTLYIVLETSARQVVTFFCEW